MRGTRPARHRRTDVNLLWTILVIVLIVALILFLVRRL